MSSQIRFLIDALSDPSVYPQPVDKIHVIQTHISVIFIAGDFVYKIKKPLNLGFLDYTTLEKRRFFCQQEVTLNSRFSQGIYLGVVDICVQNSRINLAGQGDIIEVAVLMKKIPEDRVLKTLLLRDEIEDSHILDLARRLEHFHSNAPQGKHISLFGAPEVIHQNLTENFEQVRNYVGLCIEQDVLDGISSRSFEFLGKYLPDFRGRVEKGFIRDLHGDLHTEHIVFLEEVMLVDCIEFNDRFRYSDIVSDLAFLLMDLDYLGFPGLSDKLHLHYSRDCDQDFVAGLYGFYKSYRAFVRGKVNSFALGEAEIPEDMKTAAMKSSRDYFKLSAWYLNIRKNPLLIVMCGLMGAGKSFIAKKLAGRTGATLIRSDVARKQILGLQVSDRRQEDYDQGIYSPNVTQDTYSYMFEQASGILGQGASVIIDASFASRDYREMARKTADLNHARFALIYVTAPDNVIRDRLTLRELDPNEPSDGRWELFHEQKSHFQEIQPSESTDLNTYESSRHSETELGNLVRNIFFK